MEFLSGLGERDKPQLGPCHHVKVNPEPGETLHRAGLTGIKA
jgi:hypothetical protein